MKTIETTYDPSVDGSIATGNVIFTGTDTEVQSLLNEVDKLKDKEIASSFIAGEYVRVRDKRCYEFCEILLVGIGNIEVADKDGKRIDIPMSSVQNMGERRILSLVGGRVQKDVAVGDLVNIGSILWQCTGGMPFTVVSGALALFSGNGKSMSINICKFAPNDSIILPDGLKGTVLGYEENDKVNIDWNGIDSTFHEESELEPWDPVTAVQRYAASFGMKVNVDVS